MSWGSPKQEQEFLHASPAVLTRLPASPDASACSRFSSSWAPPRSALQSLTSWSRYASSASLQRLASPCLLPYRSPPRQVGVDAARPQVQVVLLPLVQSQKVSLNLEVLLNLQVFSRRQPRRHAVLLNVPWSTRLSFPGFTRLRMMVPSTSSDAPLAAWRESPLLTMGCLLFQRWF